MKAVIHYHVGWEHQELAAQRMAAGLQRHGIDIVFETNDRPVEADMVALWAWKRPAVLEAAQKSGTPILLMERGHIQPIKEWISCGLNGVGNRGIYPKCTDDGARWNKLFSHHLKPWRQDGNYALVCGQMPGDPVLHGADIRKWAQNMVDQLRAKGYAVRFRPHPFLAPLGDHWRPENAEYAPVSLAEDLAGARLVVTFNSTTAIESVFAGIPTVTWDIGAMAWNVTTHNLEDTPIRPDRTEWCHDMAWTQWSPEEIENGTMWDSFRTCMDTVKRAP